MRRLQEEVQETPDIELPPGAASLAELPAPVQEAIGRLEHLFHRERLPQMEIGAIYREVSFVGGPEKAGIVADSLARTGLKVEDTIYVGDSLTDVQAFQAVRDGGGLAISFNGSRHALNAAEVAVVSDSAWSIGMLTAIFRLWGKEGVLEVASPERRGKSRALVLPEEMIEPIALGLQGRCFQSLSDPRPRPGAAGPGEQSHAGRPPGCSHRRPGAEKTESDFRERQPSLEPKPTHDLEDTHQSSSFGGRILGAREPSPREHTFRPRRAWTF